MFVGSVNMTDQSLGRGKFAGLLLLLQGLLLILFVVFVRYSKDLLPGFEDGNKTDPTYFGKQRFHDLIKFKLSFVVFQFLINNLKCIIVSFPSVRGPAFHGFYWVRPVVYFPEEIWI